MQIGALNRSMWAGGFLLVALTFAPAQAAPQSREDTAYTATASEDNTDGTVAGTAVIGSATTAPPDHTAVVQAVTGTAPAKTASAPIAQDRDVGRSIREVSKPLFEELAHSDVAEAVRALDNGKTSPVDADLNDGNQAEDHAEPGARRRNWDGSGQRQARENNGQPQAVNRDPERDKARAALLMSGLIDEIKPWAFGAAILYVLAYIAKFSLAARRRTVQRRMERHKYNRRTANSQNNSQHGRP